MNKENFSRSLAVWKEKEDQGNVSLDKFVDSGEFITECEDDIYSSTVFKVLIKQQIVFMNRKMEVILNECDSLEKEHLLLAITIIARNDSITDVHFLLNGHKELLSDFGYEILEIEPNVILYGKDAIRLTFYESEHPNISVSMVINIKNDETIYLSNYTKSIEADSQGNYHYILPSSVILKDAFTCADSIIQRLKYSLNKKLSQIEEPVRFNTFDVH